MSITPIYIDQLRRAENLEGLVFRGCGGSLQEWQDGVNNLLTESGILENGSAGTGNAATDHPMS